MERVSEAQRMASMDMRSSEANRRPGKRGGSMDDEEADPELQRMMQQSGKGGKSGGKGGKGGGKGGKGGGGGKGKSGGGKGKGGGGGKRKKERSCGLVGACWVLCGILGIPCGLVGVLCIL